MAHDADAPAQALLRQAYYLTGPTASGKTAVGIALAQRLDAEIIALDSMTLYRGMDIGTAKPTPDERAAVPHHLLDVLDPSESASVALYRAWAIATAKEIGARGKHVLFVGGTALYLKALLRGLFEGPAADLALRQTLEQEAAERGDSALHARLRELDPASAARLHPNDRRRIVRAIEVTTLTGTPMSAWQNEHDRPATGFGVVALERDRADLQGRIASRLDQMIQLGFVDEVRALAAQPLHRVPRQAVGYHELLEHLEGRTPLVEAQSRIELRTRRFAKHQQTWFRNLVEVERLPVAPDEITEQIVRRLETRFRSPRR